jgi:hypothetical protein
MARSKKGKGPSKTNTKRKVKAQPAKATWNDVVELARLLDGTNIKVATGTLAFKEKLEKCSIKDAKIEQIIRDLATAVTNSKSKLAAEVVDVPKEANVEVTEDMYPTYLMKYSNLIDIKDDIYMEVIPLFADLSEIMLTLEEESKLEEK